LIFDWHDRCFIAHMLKKQFMPPGQSFSLGKIPSLLIVLLALAAVSLRAEEPLIILATAKNYSVPVTIPAPVSHLEKKPVPALAALKLADETEIEFLSRIHLEKQMINESRNHNFNLKVGYGEIWHGQSEIEKIPADRRPTSFAYFKARFSF
jgi:hypothetical protein